MRLKKLRQSPLLSWISPFLVFQIAFSSVLLPMAGAQTGARTSAIDPTRDAVEATLREVSTEFNLALDQSSGLESVSESGRPQASRSAHLHPHQYHRVYGRDGRILNEWNLAQIDVSNPNVEVGDAGSELTFAYSPQKRELEIRQVANRAGEVHAHVFKEIELTSNVLADAAMVYYASADGVHGILMKHVQSSFCKKILVSPVVLTGDPSSPMRKLEFFTQEMRPQDLGAEFLDDGDLIITFDNRIERVNRAETILNLGSNLLGMLGLVQAVNPDMDNLELYQRIFKENGEDLAAYLGAQRALVDDPHNDLVLHALRAWGQKLDYNELGLLFERNSSGQNQFQALASAPRNRVSGNPAPGGTWSRNNQIIRDGQADDIRVGRTARGWRQIITDHYTGKDVNAEEAKAAARKAMSIRKRMFNRIQEYFSSAVNRKRAARVAIALGATGTGVIVDQAFFGGAGAEWIFAGMNRMLNWSAEVPLLGNLTGPIAKSIGFFTDASQRWGVARLVAGTAAVLAMCPISFGLAKLAANRAKAGWNAVRAFFTYGTRLYATINFPIQKLLIWDRLRQKGLYEAVVHNKASLTNPTLYNSPLAGKDQLDQKPGAINASLEADAVRKGRAVLLAAAIVSEGESAKGYDLDIGTLLLASQEKDFNPATVVARMKTAAGHAKWTDVLNKAYAGLVDLGDNGGSISRAELNGYVKLYRDLAVKFRHEKGTATGDFLRKLLRRSRNLMSRKILPMLAFGQQWYEAYYRYKNVHLSDDTLEMAKHGYTEDYNTSSVIYALTDPKKFADIPILGIGAPEIITNQLSQVFVYGVQGAIDPPNPKEGLKNPYTPVTNDILRDQRARQQTVGEGFGSVGRAMADGSAFRQHASVMEKLIEGLQVRFAADYLTRAVGLYLTMYLLNENPDALQIAYKSLQLSGFFLLAKISFQAGAGGFVPGYATIWPYIQASMARMQGDSAANLEQIQLADYLLTTAAETRDEAMLRDGVELLQELYARGRIQLPAEYAAAPEAFSFELAEKFHQFSLEKGNVPLPTEKSKALFANVNRGGAILSTVLFAGVSAIAMDPSTNATELLVKSLAWFGITYGGMKVASTVIPYAIGQVNTTVIQPVRRKLLELKGTMAEICNRAWGGGRNRIN